MNSRVLSRIEKRIHGQCFVMHRKESVAERSFGSGQKRILSWTEKSSVITSGQKRDLSWTEKSFNMHRKSLVMDRKSLVMDRENLVMAVLGHRTAPAQTFN